MKLKKQKTLKNVQEKFRIALKNPPLVDFFKQQFYLQSCYLQR